MLERPQLKLIHRDGRGEWLWYVLLISATLLQKVAIPGTGGVLPISTAALVGCIGLALVNQSLVIDGARLFTFLLFLASTSASLVLSDSDRVSVPSWLFVLVIQGAFVVRAAPGRMNLLRVERFISALALTSAVIGLAQFVAQFVIGPKLAFPIEHFLPSAMLLKGFVNIIPITWDSPILKSNGIFFAEPSFFCQFLALGLILELLQGARLVRLTVLACAILSSFSGTGLMTIFVFLPRYVTTRRRIGVVIAGAAGFFLLTQLPFLHLSALTDRASEFSETRSSGFSRFISMFYIIDQFILREPLTLLFGRGPGTVTEHFADLPFGTFDPTWGKIFYEDGLIGFLLYASFFTRSFVMARPGLRLPLAFTYFFSGGYLVNASVVAQLLILVSWPNVARLDMSKRPVAAYADSNAIRRRPQQT